MSTEISFQLYMKSYLHNLNLLYAVGWRPEGPNGSEQPDRRENQRDGGLPGQVQTVRDSPTGLYFSHRNVNFYRTLQ